MNKQMRVIEVSSFGGPENLTIGQRPIPEPSSGEVLIEIVAAGLNRADVMQRNGNYPPPPGASDLLGLEVSGTIVEVADDVTDLNQGDTVCALLTAGGYAEYCTAPASSCLPIPQKVDIAEAAALPETFFTVWANMFMLGQLKRDDRVLIHGGTSGIGTTAIQLAKAFGANVITTAGSDNKCDYCTALGADRAVNYRTSEFVDEVISWSDGRGVDVILDIVAGSYVPKNVKCLAPFGRLVIIATQGGFRSEINVLPFMTKRLTLTGSTLRPRTVEEKQQIACQLKAEVWPMLDAGVIKPIIDSVFSFDDVQQAHHRLESGDHIGKIILTMN